MIKTRPLFAGNLICKLEPRVQIQFFLFSPFITVKLLLYINITCVMQSPARAQRVSGARNLTKAENFNKEESIPCL